MSKILTLRLDDYDDAAGTAGGDAMMTITVLHEGTPQTTFTYFCATDEYVERLHVLKEHVSSPIWHMNHMHLAVNAMAYVFMCFSDNHEFYSDVFMKNDIDYPHYDLTWDLDEKLSFFDGKKEPASFSQAF